MLLDAPTRRRDSDGMIRQPYQLHVERHEPARNMARYYQLSIEPTLFGDVMLLRQWGRIGTRGQQISHLFEREDDAVRAFLDVLRQKRLRGYRVRGEATNRTGLSHNSA